MTKRYFVVELTDGRVIDFDKRCNEVEYKDDPNYVKFKHTSNGGSTWISLAFIPHKSIFSIFMMEEE